VGAAGAGRLWEKSDPNAHRDPGVADRAYGDGGAHAVGASDVNPQADVDAYGPANGGRGDAIA
jgi:hypothetical protein